MRREEILSWFDGLVENSKTIPKSRAGYDDYYDEMPGRQWATEAEAALTSVFPERHSVRLAWDRIILTIRRNDFAERLDALIGVFKGAATLIRDGRLGTLIDAIRVETESDLLEQAEILLNANHLAAAAGIAGGALETHLRYLVAKHGLTIAGEGSIAKYNNSVGQERNKGNLIYSAADGDSVNSWGKTRNDAAHDPGNFKATKDQIKLMIEGVRQFVARTTPV